VIAAVIDSPYIAAFEIDIFIHKTNGEIEKNTAINEVTLINPVNTQRLNIALNGSHFEKFNGTGICISTPTGSTGYNKSLQGAILPSYIKAFQLTEIAGINNTKYRTIKNSLIFDDTDCVRIEPIFDHDFSDSILSIDGTMFSLKNCDYIEIKVSDQRIKLAINKDSKF